jgi:hypothetical protein
VRRGTQDHPRPVELHKGTERRAKAWTQPDPETSPRGWIRQVTHLSKGSVAALLVFSLIAGCSTDKEETFGQAATAQAFASLPNIVAYQGREYEFGSEAAWPDGTPTTCDELVADNVSGLKQVGYLSNVGRDETASLGHIGASGSVKAYTARRSPPPRTKVVVLEPTQECFVVYSPMV